MTPDIIPPHSTEHEMCVLGSMLLGSEIGAVGTAASMLVADDFYLTAHRQIFQCMVDLWRANKPTDLLTVPEELRRRGQLEGIGGVGYLGDLVEGTPSAQNVTHYADVVRERSALRQIITACARATKDAYAATKDPEKTVASITRSMQDALDATTRGGEVVHIAKSVDAVLVEAQKPPAERKKRVDFGCDTIDQMVGGMWGGELVTIGARTSGGKTALASQCVWSLCNAGGAALVFSMEMTPAQMAARMLVPHNEGDITLYSFRETMNSAKIDHLKYQAQRVRDFRLWIDYKTRTADGMHAAVRKAIREHKIDLVVVDFLMLMDVPGGKDNKASRVAENVVALQRIAVEEGIPLLLLSQLNRDNVKAGRKPTLADLKESGAIEECSRVVVLLHQPDERDPEAITAVVAKNNNGPVGDCKLWFDRKRQWFHDHIYHPGVESVVTRPKPSGSPF